MRDFANTDIRFNKNMNPEDRLPLGIQPKDTIPTMINVPAGQATAEITYAGAGVLVLHCKHHEGTPADEKADHGYRIHYGILPQGGATLEQAAGAKHYLQKPPTLGDELPHSKFSKRKKVMFAEEFQGESGKTAYFSIRYENSKGKPGPWGPMLKAIVP